MIGFFFLEFMMKFGFLNEFKGNILQVMEGRQANEGENILGQTAAQITALLFEKILYNPCDFLFSTKCISGST